MTIQNLTRETVRTHWDTPDLYWDDQLKGFGLKVRQGADGTLQRSFIIQFRIGKKQRKIKLGDAAKINVDQARKKAEKLFAEITLGTDPAAKKDEERKALTFRQCVDKYLAMKESEIKVPKYSRLYLTGRYFAALHRMGINDITRKDIAPRLAAIRSEVSDMTAGRARAHLSAFFARAIQEGWCDKDENPCIGTKPQQDRPRRDRVLDDKELKAVWDATAGDGDYHRIIRLLILTGCRREEIGGLRWSEIDLEQGTITIPAERTKNKRTHALPLPLMALDIIASVPKLTDRDLVFGSRSATGFRSWGQEKAKLRDGIEKHWTVHDLRRTFRTGLGKLGVKPHIAELAINHARDGLVETYDRHTYQAEIAQALALWADHVGSIVSGNARKVIPLRA